MKLVKLFDDGHIMPNAYSKLHS